MRQPTPIPQRDADLAARRVALGLSRNHLASLALVGAGIVLRAENGCGRSYTNREAKRVDLILSALETARREAAALVVGAA
jgi:hypothetical protein